MKVQHRGIVTKIYKDPIDLWCVEIKRDNTLVKGGATYTKIKVKPKIKVGQKVEVGDEI